MNQGVLSEPTLVLDRGWRPVRVCSVRRALGMVYKDLAFVIGEGYVTYDFWTWCELAVCSGEPSIRAVSFSLRIPDVIVLRRGERFFRPRVVFSRRNLLRRDRHTCQYCGKHYAADKLSIDHVIPRALGGVSSWTNCVVACRSCNSRKADRRPEQVGMTTLQPPAEPPSHLALEYECGRSKPSWQRFVPAAPGVRVPGASA